MLVITGYALDPAAEECIRRYLAKNMPGWENFEIASSGKYLGIWLGPQTEEKQWSKAIDKYNFRCSEIASIGAAASISARLYNMYSLPVLGYICQFHQPTKEIQSAELHGLHKVLHMPPQSFGLAEILSLDVLGGVDFNSIDATCRAAMFRAAASTFQWTEWHEAVFNEAQDCLNISECLSGDFCPSGWDSRAIVSNLRSSQLGMNPFVRCPVNLANGRKILKEATKDSARAGEKTQTRSLAKTSGLKCGLAASVERVLRRSAK